LALASTFSVADSAIAAIRREILGNSFTFKAYLKIAFRLETGGALQAALTGLLTGLSLIIAIGAQNAFVLRQGLAKERVLVVVTICSLSDALLILLGVYGLGSLIESIPYALEIIRWFGIAYLLWFAYTSIKRAFQIQSLKVDGEKVVGLKQLVLTTLAFTFLNPHVYLDTVIFLGGLSHQFDNEELLFAFGAMSASFLWFYSLGFLASKLSKLMSKPVFWKVLDLGIALVMLSVATALAFYRFN
jgi:L-lysine exporter family protein LysE/ArgO